MRRPALGALLATTALALLLVAAPLTLARFGDSSAITGEFHTATLRPPTSLTGTGGTTAALAWTPSTSGWATGYDVLRSATSGSGYSQVGTVTPVSASATTDGPATGTWYYVLTTYFHNWTSANSNEASVTVAAATVTTALKDCTSNAAVTENAGDNDGYEGNPARACAEDGSYATDNATGTSTANSCTAPTKDRHDFWGYAFGLPGTVSSITGLTVRPVAGQSNNGGTSWVCVQLSWNGGASWTAPQSVPLSSSALTAYTLGGASDTWGRSWTSAELASGTFRVRVIDSSSHPNKQLRLDAIGVSVSYQP